MYVDSYFEGTLDVTPFAGVWIEMNYLLKRHKYLLVTPFAGVWIEIFQREEIKSMKECHSLCGSVD